MTKFGNRVLVFALAALCVPRTADAWSKSIIEQVSSLGSGHTSLALVPPGFAGEGRARIVYVKGSNDLVYAEEGEPNVGCDSVATTFTTQTIGGGIPTLPSIALSPVDGLPRVAHMAEETPCSGGTCTTVVKYRTCDAEPCTDSANWVATTVATVGACTLPVGSTGIAVDDEDGVWISYYDCVFGNLAVAHCDLPPCTLAGDWTVATVDSLGDVGDSNSIALRAAKYPAVSYRDYTNQRLKYARCSFGITSECDWTVSVLDDGTYDAPYAGPGFGSSLEFSPDTDPAGNGRPRIAYWDGETSELLHGVCGMASCATFPTYALAENEGAVSFKVGLGLDPSNEGAAYVAYFNNEAAGCGSDS
ncbi:MAG: hypothetical protein AABZ30_00405 [Myxococcota bacterium]